MSDDSTGQEFNEEFFNPEIPGLETLLFQAAPTEAQPAGGETPAPLQEKDQGKDERRGFKYYRSGGLRMVVYGPPGVGKTILALQMAVAAALEGRKVIYLTKDTRARVLHKRISEAFRFFQGETVEVPPAEGPSNWLVRHTLRFDGAHEPRSQQLKVAFLDELLNSLRPREVSKAPVDATQKLEDQLDNLDGGGFLAFADFNEAPFAIRRLDRYVLTGSAYQALGLLQPSLKPVFDALEPQDPDAKSQSQSGAAKAQASPTDDEPDGKASNKGVFIVCDSLSSAMLSEHLRIQSQQDQGGEKSKAGDEGQTGRTKGKESVVFLFVLESAELPEAMNVAYAPDVQIRLGNREEAHGVKTRTLQLVKTRFQSSLDEATPFVICGGGPDYAAAWEYTLVGLDANGPMLNPSKALAPSIFTHRKPGIHIMPPVIHEGMESRRERPRSKDGKPVGREDPDDKDLDHRRGIKFLVERMDGCTQEKHLARGGCTLLVTQNRCGSTALSLHYLLAQIGRVCGVMPELTPPADDPLDLRSVLHINFSGDVEEMLHTLWRFPVLRRAMYSEKDDSKAEHLEKLWSDIEKACRIEEPQAAGESEAREPRHRLYRIPLLRTLPTLPESFRTKCRKTGPYLYIYVPDFTWLTAEEAMERIATLLQYKSHHTSLEGCCHCLQVSRVVLDRVGRLPARWPLVRNHEVFVSGVVALCDRLGVEIMLIDDTAELDETSGTFRSRWIGVAQNIIRLRRMSFHGTAAMTVELIKATSRLGTWVRPHELVFRKGEGDFDDKLVVEDSFRGYTGLAIGRPERCKIKVGLSYDAERTALHREVLAAKESLQSAMDQVDVQVLGPGQWSGIYSAFNNLSSVSRDTCHVVAIDGLWLQSLLKAGTLHRLTDEEFKHVLPGHIQNAIGYNPDPEHCSAGPDGKELNEKVDEQYVTRSVTTAMAKLCEDAGKSFDLGLGIRSAVPMRHNWGVLIVAKPFSSFVEEALLEAIKLEKKEWEKAPAEAQSNKARSFTASLWVLLGRELRVTDGLEWLKGKWDAGKQVSDSIWRKIWHDSWGPLTWEEIASFRTDYWHKFWEGGWVEKRLAEVCSTKGATSVPWLALFPRIELFGIAKTTSGTVLSFLFELLLAEMDWDDLFETVRPKSDVSLLRFKTHDSGAPDARINPQCLKGFTDTLVLFYRLLSSAQRRQSGIGVRTVHSDTGTPSRNRLTLPGHVQTAFGDWPAQISLLSREWITTVQDLLPRLEAREALFMAPLPSGKASKSYWAKTDLWGGKDLTRVAANYGPTVAGVWYLGTLSGGNTDLATDVMKEILSTEHESSRLLRRSGAPVSREFYKKDWLGLDGSVAQSSRLPYADVMHHLYANETDAVAPGQAQRQIMFPFYRTQMVDYLDVSAVLHDLVQQVMRIQVEDEGILESKWVELARAKAEKGTPEPKPKELEKFITFRLEVEGLVKQAFMRLKALRVSAGGGGKATNAAPKAS